jgi:flavodoxin
MSVEILVHSQTGHCLSVAEILAGLARSAGHRTSLTRIIPSDEKETDPAKLSITPVPQDAGADLYVIGAPVHGFSATPAIRKAVAQMPFLDGKRVVLFATEFLPIGGTHTLKQLEQDVADQGGQVVATGIIHWERKDREEQIEAFSRRFSQVLQGDPDSEPEVGG